MERSDPPTNVGSTVGLGAWRPIETAPCYGRVLLWWRHAGPRIGRLVSDETGDGWRTDGDECVPRNQRDCTHWMPLPEAPNAEIRGD